MSCSCHSLLRFCLDAPYLSFTDTFLIGCPHSVCHCLVFDWMSTKLSFTIKVLNGCPRSVQMSGGFSNTNIIPFSLSPYAVESVPAPRVHAPSAPVLELLPRCHLPVSPTLSSPAMLAFAPWAPAASRGVYLRRETISPESPSHRTYRHDTL